MWKSCKGYTEKDIKGATVFAGALTYMYNYKESGKSESKYINGVEYRYVTSEDIDKIKKIHSLGNIGANKDIEKLKNYEKILKENLEVCKNPVKSLEIGLGGISLMNWYEMTNDCHNGASFFSKRNLPFLPNHIRILCEVIEKDLDKNYRSYVYAIQDYENQQKQVDIFCPYGLNGEKLEQIKRSNKEGLRFLECIVQTLSRDKAVEALENVIKRKVGKQNPTILDKIKKIDEALERNKKAFSKAESKFEALKTQYGCKTDEALKEYCLNNGKTATYYNLKRTLSNSLKSLGEGAKAAKTLVIREATFEKIKIEDVPELLEEKYNSNGVKVKVRPTVKASRVFEEFSDNSRNGAFEEVRREYNAAQSAIQQDASDEISKNLSSYKDAQEDAKKNAKELNNSKPEGNSKYEELVKALEAQLDKQKRKTEGRIRELEDELREAEDANDAKEERIRELESKVKELEDIIDAEKGKNRNLQEDLDNERNKPAVEKPVERVVEKVIRRNGTTTTIENTEKIDALSKELSDRDGQLNQQQSALNDKDNEINRLRQQNNQLRNQLNNANQSNEQKPESNEGAEDLEAQRQNLARFQAELENLQNELNSREADVERREQSLRQRTQEAQGTILQMQNIINGGQEGLKPQIQTINGGQNESNKNNNVELMPQNINLSAVGA